MSLRLLHCAPPLPGLCSHKEAVQLSFVMDFQSCGRDCIVCGIHISYLTLGQSTRPAVREKPDFKSGLPLTKRGATHLPEAQHLSGKSMVAKGGQQERWLAKEATEPHRTSTTCSVLKPGNTDMTKRTLQEPFPVCVACSPQPKSSASGTE
ncbi:uncharacterized protein LOC120224341 isoform X2 [Hyaena hyaena]|uniref:uncharacterized protein LOC120224341 isoform X2 n=1 Tax=Hyaena hyaena TaxID=95912 RepID=UPI0019209D62|nr:uncharacterized protein LOC120224341 isoform X2 [Hyaena hyaena]